MYSLYFFCIRRKSILAQEKFLRMLEDMFYLVNSMNERTQDILLDYFSSVETEDPYRFCEATFGHTHKAIDDARLQAKLFLYCNQDVIRNTHDDLIDVLIQKKHNIDEYQFKELSGDKYSWTSILILFLFLEAYRNGEEKMVRYLVDSYNTSLMAATIFHDLMDEMV